MKLYFVRHADAMAGADDAVRPLSPRGREDAGRLARYLRGLGVTFDVGYSSPLVRARQTAEIVLAACGSERDRPPVLRDELLNEASPSLFKRWLKSLADTQKALLVGHAPSLDEHVARLLDVPDPAAVALSKGTVACIETEDGRRGRLRFFLPPKCLPG